MLWQARPPSQATLGTPVRAVRLEPVATARPAHRAAAAARTSGNTDTPEQIASDQAAIDTAQANLTEAQQSLKEATLTSPISGTVVSVAISTGDTVSAGSSTEIITILGTNSYEIEATLDSSQIPSVKVGQAATVEVDGVDETLNGTVSQVGPVQSSSSGYSYPVIVALPASSSSAMHSGSTGNVTITTGAVSNVVAVPTSAVQSFGTTSYVTELSRGQLTRKVIKVGMVGDTYIQVDSGLSPGQSVVLVDYAEAVPSSNTNTNLGTVLGGGGVAVAASSRAVAVERSSSNASARAVAGSRAANRFRARSAPERLGPSWYRRCIVSPPVSDPAQLVDLERYPLQRPEADAYRRRRGAGPSAAP